MMSAAFSQIGQIVQTAMFQQRVNYAMCVAAQNVYSESAGTTGHAARASYAVKVLAGNFNLEGACYGVMTNPTIAAEATTVVGSTPGSENGIPDSDIQFAVNSIWSALAGA